MARTRPGQGAFRLGEIQGLRQRDLRQAQSGRDQDRMELYRLMQEITALFAGGHLSASDRELFLDAMTELVRESYDS